MGLAEVIDAQEEGRIQPVSATDPVK